ncbi:uncharacterized protein LOC135489082 [Lineus longissimus]|uniref:uncharacterized protein LOC135489082 n=1 Tax=Lineus longissimus TaxID=88925 RepID=UPI00315DBB08
MKSAVRFCASVGFLILLCIFIIHMTDDALLEPLPTFEPAMNGSGKVPLFIPKIIHQTYSSEAAVPRVYADCIRSCLRANPDWRYMFWSDKDARNFIRDKYPTYLGLFDKYDNKLLKADAMRYFVLDFYGGLYMDMDMQCLRPIKTFLAEKRLVLVPEPHVQSFLLHKNFSIVTNAIMASEPSHPFLRYVIDHLQHFQRHTSINNAIYVTGPNMLQKVLEDYQSRIPCLESRCKVFVADPTEMMPTVDPYWLRLMKKFTKDCMTKTNFVTFVEFKTCIWVQLKNYNPLLTNKSYTNHVWKHIGYKGPISRFFGRKVSIKDIVGTGREIERYVSER